MERFPDGDGDDEMTAKRDRNTFGNRHDEPSDPSSSELSNVANADSTFIDSVFLELAHEHAEEIFNHLPDLSVSDEVAAELKHRRWYGVVEVALPSPFHGMTDEVLEDFVADHLRGREPLPAAEGDSIRVTFAIHDDSAQEAAEISRFAVGLARFVDAGPNAIVRQQAIYLDTSEFDHFCPDDRWPFSA
jgi:hypothetical protein